MRRHHLSDELMHGQDEAKVGSDVLADGLRRAAIEDLYEFAPVGCAVILEDGTILNANLTLAAMLNVPRERLLGSPLVEYLASDDRIPALRFLSRITPEHGDAPLEVRVLPVDGKPRVCVLSAARSEQAASIRIALTDETGRRAAERIALQAQKMEAIGRMAGGIAHDLNNVLTVVSVHDDFLLTSLPPDDPKREDLLAIQEALRKAAALTTTLLSFARPQVLNRRRISVNGVVDEFARVLRRELAGGVELITEFAVPPAEVEIDPAQLEQVLRHLVRNAEEAMPAGGRITISTTSVEVAAAQLVGRLGVQPGWFACIQVSDTGIGMDPPTLSRVFEPYFTTKPHGERHGLGLATAYAVAHQNGGFATADSVEGDGTTLRVYLPAAEQLEPPSISAPTPDAVMGTESILIAEDDAAIRNVIQRMLSKQGYRCHVANDGEDALRQLAVLDGQVDLLLSDVVMPNCTGPELVQRMRERHPDIPVVFMTGYASADEVEDTPLPKVFGVLHKPFALQALRKMVREAIDDA